YTRDDVKEPMTFQVLEIIDSASPEKKKVYLSDGSHFIVSLMTVPTATSAASASATTPTLTVYSIVNITNYTLASHGEGKNLIVHAYSILSSPSSSTGETTGVKGGVSPLVGRPVNICRSGPEWMIPP